MGIPEIPLRHNGPGMPGTEFIVAGRGGEERGKPLELERSLYPAAQPVDQKADLHRLGGSCSGDCSGTKLQRGALCGKKVRIRRINYLVLRQTQCTDKGFF